MKKFKMSDRNIKKSVASIIGISVLMLCFNVVELFVLHSIYSKHILNGLNIILTISILVFTYIIVQDYHYNEKEKENEAIIKNALFDIMYLNTENTSIEDVCEMTLKKFIESIPRYKHASVSKLNEGNMCQFIAQVGYADNLKDISIPLKDVYLFKETKGKMDKVCIIENRETNVKTGDDGIVVFSEKKVLNEFRTISSPINVEGKFWGQMNFDILDHEKIEQYEIDIIRAFSYELAKIIKISLTMEKNSELINKDFLTKAWSRTYFDKFVSGLITKENRFSLVSIDLDKFKIANDKFGHLFGDHVLKFFVQGVELHLQGRDLIARYGGDEFHIVLINRTHSESKEIMKQIYYYINNTGIEIDNEIYHQDFTYNIAYYPKDAQDLRSLLSLNDEKLYEKKNKKKANEK